MSKKINNKVASIGCMFFGLALVKIGMDSSAIIALRGISLGLFFLSSFFFFSEKEKLASEAILYILFSVISWFFFGFGSNLFILIAMIIGSVVGGYLHFNLQKSQVETLIVVENKPPSRLKYMVRYGWCVLILFAPWAVLFDMYGENLVNRFFSLQLEFVEYGAIGWSFLTSIFFTFTLFAEKPVNKNTIEKPSFFDKNTN